MIRRFINFLKKSFGGGDEPTNTNALSKFRHFYEQMSPNDPTYPGVRQAAGLCDDALRIAKHRIRLSSQLNEIEEKLTELESYNNLTEEEVKELRQMLDRFTSLSRERTMLLEQLSKFDNSLTEMFRLENQAVVAVPQIKDAEKHQRALKQDIGYLLGEKDELITERSDMNRTLTFIRKFTIGMAAVFVFAELLLIIMYFSAEWDIFVPTAILILLVMAIVSLLYFFRQKLRGEMRRNLRKQHRAIELLNKKNVVLAYYMNYLRYSYRKYKIKNSRMLETNLKEFGDYKFLANRIDVCRSLMYETEENIERFMRAKKLTGIKATIEGFAKTVNLEDKRRYYNEQAARKDACEKELANLDVKHEEIWDTLMVLNERDRSHNRAIESVIAYYLIEAGKLFETTDEMKNKDKEAANEKAT